jgi:hypothetical protein
LIIKQEPVSESARTITANASTNSLFRTLTENGQEVLELLDSDHEMEPSARVKHVPNASVAIKERALSPDLVIKQEPGIVTTNATNSESLFRNLTENISEVIELLDSDHEMEPVDASEDKGMSSDTMVGDFDIEMDSDDDEDPHLFHDQEKSNSSASDSDDDSDFDQPISSNWLDDSISSTVKQGPIKITRQCKVDAVEYLSDLPSYWPVPRNKRAYVVDLSDPKFNVYDKNGKLMTVDALIKNAVRTNFFIPHHKFNR